MRRLLWVPALVFASAACGGGNAASNLAKLPEMPTSKQAKCGVTKSQSEPLIVEWPDSARGKLESLRRRGLVAVHYEGCELEVLRCQGRAQYDYSAITRKQSRMTIKDEDDLYANLPVGAVKLEAKLKTLGQLNVQMTLVGRYETRAGAVTRDDLVGDDCDRATHVIGALSVGAFTFFAGADAAVGGGATGLGAGAGANSAAKRELLQQDGDDAACAKSLGTDTAPPYGCGALIQVEVVTIGVAPQKVAIIAPAPVPTLRVMPPPIEPPAPRSGQLRCGPSQHIEHEVCVDDVQAAAPVVVADHTQQHQPAPEYTRPEPTKTAGGNTMIHTVLGFTTLGALSVSLVAGVLASTNAADVTDSSKNLCSEQTKVCNPEGLAKKDAAITWGWVSSISLGAAAVTGVLYYVLPRPPADASVGFTPLPGGGALTTQGRF